MKKASFTALLYREFYLVRQANLINLLSFTGCAVLGWLMLLSIRYGNFALLFSEHPDSSSSILSNEAIMNMLRLFIIAGIKYFPLLMAGAFALTTADVAAKDSMTNWNRFSHCTPVTPLRFASVRLLVTVASTAASFLLATGYLISVECGMGEPFSYGDFSILVLMVSCYIVFGVLGQIFVTLLRNKDAGMLCAMGFVMAPVMIISAANSNHDAEVDTLESTAGIMSFLTDTAKAFCPILLAVIGGLFVLLFISMYLLYKRREK